LAPKFTSKELPKASVAQGSLFKPCGFSRSPVSARRFGVGNWDGKRGYLGFRFPSPTGKNDFGWVKMSCSANGQSCHLAELAYDTVPGQTIEADQTSAIPEPGTLSLLALGAAGLAVLRRRKRSAVSRQQSASE